MKERFWEEWRKPDRVIVRGRSVGGLFEVQLLDVRGKCWDGFDFAYASRITVRPLWRKKFQCAQFFKIMHEAREMFTTLTNTIRPDILVKKANYLPWTAEEIEQARTQ